MEEKKKIKYEPKIKRVKFIFAKGLEKTDTHPIELHLYTLFSDIAEKFNKEKGEIIVTVLDVGKNHYEIHVNNKELHTEMINRLKARVDSSNPYKTNPY